MQEVFGLFNAVSSFLWGFLLITGLTGWAVIGTLRLLDLFKIKKDKDGSDSK